VQVAFRTTDMKPLAILSLRVELQPHTVSQTFRFNHPEHSIMKKSIRVPPLHSLAGTVLCSHTTSVSRDENGQMDIWHLDKRQVSKQEAEREIRNR